MRYLEGRLIAEAIQVGIHARELCGGGSNFQSQNSEDMEVFIASDSFIPFLAPSYSSP